MRADDHRDRCRGIMLGMACGDALGAQVEFARRDTFPAQTEMTGGGPHDLQPGQWTDDTAMALALSDWMLSEYARESALALRAPERSEHAAGLMARWLSWRDHGAYSCTGTCFDIGTRTAAALAHWESTGTVLPERGRGVPYALGNGAVMRVAPVAVRLHGSSHALTLATWQAELTHGRRAARLTAVWVVALDLLLRGETPHNAVGAAVVWSREIGAPIRDVRHLARSQIRSGGVCSETVEASLWSLCGAHSPEEAICDAVSLGSDSDTTAACAGALAGAHWGASSLPPRWLGRLAWRDEVERTADRLLDARLAYLGGMG